MARTMGLTNIGIYRTVVRTEFIEDSEEKTRVWDDDSGSYELHPVYHKGQVVTEVFGPYVANAQNQNYSTIRTGYVRSTGEPLSREDYYWASDDAWERDYSKRTKTEYVYVANQTAQYQKIAPVFALQPNGSLTMELDWVQYGN